MVLLNPGAPVSSLNWEEIEVPGDVPIPCYDYAFAPLNSTEIIIAGGMDENWETFGDILTLDTITCELKREVVDKDPFYCPYN